MSKFLFNFLIFLESRLHKPTFDLTVNIDFVNMQPKFRNILF